MFIKFSGNRSEENLKQGKTKRELFLETEFFRAFISKPSFQKRELNRIFSQSKFSPKTRTENKI